MILMFYFKIVVVCLRSVRTAEIQFTSDGRELSDISHEASTGHGGKCLLASKMSLDSLPS